MTFNWGHKLTIVFLAFGTLIFALVFKSMTTHFDLVSKEYYKDELAYQQIIDGKNNSKSSSMKAAASVVGERIEIRIPGNAGTATGKIWFYCPMDASRDRQYSIIANEKGSQTLNLGDFQPGKYIVKFQWEQEGISYYNEQLLSIQP